MKTNKKFNLFKFTVLAGLLTLLLLTTMLTAFASETTHTVKIEEIGTGELTVKVNDAIQDSKELNVNDGDILTIETESENFYCFTNTQNNVLSSKNTFSIEVKDDIGIRAFFLNTDVEKVMLIYQNVGLSNQILSVQTINKANFNTAFTEHTVKKASIPGYSFINWDKSVNEIKTSVSNGDKNVIVKPTYVPYEQSFEIAVSGGTIQNLSDSGMYVQNSYVYLKADEPADGEVFAYWTDGTGRVLSTSKAIKIAVTADQLYTAVFVKESEQGGTEPIVGITGTYDSNFGCFSLLSHRYLPKDYTLLSYGMVFAKEKLLDDEELTLDSKIDGVKSVVSYTYSSINGYWTNTITINKTLSIRSYIRYKDLNGVEHLLYSDVLQFKPLESVIGQEDFNGDYSGNHNITVNGDYSINSTKRLAVVKGSVNFDVDFSKSSKIVSKFNLYFNNNSMQDNLNLVYMYSDYTGDESSSEGIILDWDNSGSVPTKRLRVPILKVDQYGFVYLNNKDGEWIKTETKVHIEKLYKFEIEFDTDNNLYTLKINDVTIDSVSFDEDRKLGFSILDSAITTHVDVDNVYVTSVLNIANECALHNYLDTVVAPTCYSNGYTVRVCKNCGAQKVCSYVLKTDHLFDCGNYDSVSGNVVFACSMCGLTKEVEYSETPYTVLYDSSDDTSYERALELEDALAEYYGFKLPLCEISEFDYQTKYIDTTGYTFVSADYGWTVENDNVTLYAGALAGRDKAVESFISELDTLGDFDAITSKNYSVSAVSTITNAKKYDQSSYDDNVIDSITNSKKNYNKNTDISSVSGTVYYVSENGDDANNGTSSSTPIKTLAKVNELVDGGTISSGDAILFERGSIFRPTTVNGSILHTVSGLTIGCYGDTSKDRPVITSSKYNYAVGNMWELVEGEENIWVLKNVTARNVGAIEFTKKDGTVIFGAKKRALQVDSGEQYSGMAYLTSNYAFFNGNGEGEDMSTFNISSFRNVYVYYEGDMNNDFSDIEITEGHNPSTNKNDIADNDKYPAIDLNDLSDVTVDGISFSHIGFEAIKIGRSVTSSPEHHSSNITIQNCIFDTCANSIQKFNTSNKGSILQKDYAIEIYSSVTNLVIKDNFFTNMLNGAILITSSAKSGIDNAVLDIDISGNIIERMYIGIDIYSYLNLATCNIKIHDNLLSKENCFLMGDEGKESYDGNNCPGALVARGFVGDDMIDFYDNIFDKAYISGVSGTTSQGIIIRTTPINNNSDIAGQVEKSLISPYMSSVDHINFSNNTVIQYNDQLILRNRVISSKSYKGDYSATSNDTFGVFPNVDGDFIVCIVERDVADFDYDFDKDAFLGRTPYVAPAVNPDAEVKKVVLCIGQSNMGGRGYLTTKTSPCVGTYNPEIAVKPISDSRLYVIDKASGYTTFKPMTEPIFVNDKGEAGASLAATFAKAYVETFNTTLGILPGAKGGTGISQWVPGSALYNNAVAMVKGAQNMGAEVIAVLWHQGESDASNHSYANNLQVIIDSLYFDTGLSMDTCPFICGELIKSRTDVGSAEASVKTKYSQSAGSTPYLNTTEFPKLQSMYGYSKFGIVDSANLRNCGEGIHIDGASCRVFGYRFFNEYCRVMGYTDKYYVFDDTINCTTWQECDQILDKYLPNAEIPATQHPAE